MNFDPWDELARLDKLQAIAFANEDDRTMQACLMAKERISAEIRARNTAGLHDKPSASASTTQQGIDDRNARILALLSEKPLPVYAIARHMQEPVERVRSFMKLLKNRGEVVYRDNVWEVSA